MQPATKQTVLKLAETCTENGKVDVIKLATKLGIDVYAISSDDINYNARIKYDKKDDKFNIYVNEDHPETRRRFSVAHEVSHFVFDYDELKQKGALERSIIYEGDEHRAQEQQADQFAAELLMPRQKVEAYVDQHHLAENGFTGHAIKSLANYFHVSKTMAITRLRSMGYPISFIVFA